MKRLLQPGHDLQLLAGGAELFPAMARAMDAAQHLVHVETYIFRFSGGALQVAEALERAAVRGVEVRLVVDGAGTPQLPPEWVARFTLAGVKWRIYAPLGRLGLLFPSRWRRLHRKLCVVDGEVGFCGGVNLIDDQQDIRLGALALPRLDYALQVRGPLVADMLHTMEQLWWRLQVLRRAQRRQFSAALDALVEAQLPVSQSLQALRALATLTFGAGQVRPTDRGAPKAAPPRQAQDGPPEPPSTSHAALLLRDNVRHRHDIERAYLKAIGEARHEVVIANAYFIPGRRLRRALMVACQRGVRVRLLLQGKYETFLQYHAARPMTHRLLKAGVEIHEYEPSSLHAKVAVVDGRWATVGSTNLDPVSLLLAREANIITTDAAFAQSLRDQLDHLMLHAGTQLDPAGSLNRPLMARLRDRVAFAIMRTVLYVLGHRY